MAHPMLKLSSFLLYILSIIAFFLIGIAYAGWIEAGKGQMLAGGAIVLGYGVVGAGLGLLLALILAYKWNPDRVYKLCLFFVLLILGFIGFFKAKYDKRQKEKEKQEVEQGPRPVTKPANDF